MTPQEKALELYQKYETLGRDFTRGVSMKEHSKQCALIAVNEILKDREEIDGMRIINDPYWIEVKQEIEKL
jgi:hypothetical protein